MINASKRFSNEDIVIVIICTEEGRLFTQKGYKRRAGNRLCVNYGGEDIWLEDRLPHNIILNMI